MNLKKLLKSGVFFTLLFGFTQSFAWQMVYHNDENGNVVSGNLDILKNAVENGHKVRVMSIGTTSKSVYDADVVWIADNKVYMINNRQLSISEYDGILKIQPTAYHFYIIYATDGVATASRWLVGQHTNVGNTVSHAELKWFID